MPLTQDELIAGESTTTLFDGRLNIRFKHDEGPTLEEEIAIHGLNTPGATVDQLTEGARALARVVARIIIEWDFLQFEGGPPIELTEDALFKEIRSSFLQDVFTGITKAKRLGEAHGTPPLNGSSPKALSRPGGRRT